MFRNAVALEAGHAEAFVTLQGEIIIGARGASATRCGPGRC
jgi:hypothetical protein